MGLPRLSEPEISLLEIASIFLRRRRLIAGCVVAGVVVVAALHVLRTDSYTARASFLPQQREGPSLRGNAAALAGQLGIAIPTGDATRSPQFYADLLHSRELLSRLADDTFPVRGDAGAPGAGEGQGETLSGILELDEASEATRRRVVAQWLRRVISTEINPQTNLVNVEVTTPWPQVSYGVALQLLELLNQFNLQQRQSQARAERTFLGTRMEEAEAELGEAEEELRQFLENNRQFQNSPQLTFEHDRLQRQVSMRQQIFVSLAQSYEEARISEVRNTPVITVVERPVYPVAPNGGGLILDLALAVIFGGMLGVLLAFGVEMLSSALWEARSQPGRLRVLRAEMEGMLGPLRRFIGRGGESGG